jgi:hypothetical protein
MEDMEPKPGPRPGWKLGAAVVLLPLRVLDVGGVASAPVLEQTIQGLRLCRRAGAVSLHPSEGPFEPSMAARPSRRPQTRVFRKG